MFCSPASLRCSMTCHSVGEAMRGHPVANPPTCTQTGLPRASPAHWIYSLALTAPLSCLFICNSSLVTNASPICVSVSGGLSIWCLLTSLFLALLHRPPLSPNSNSQIPKRLQSSFSQEDEIAMSCAQFLITPISTADHWRPVRSPFLPAHPV